MAAKGSGQESDRQTGMDRLRESEERVALLTNEIDHRAKNMLTVVAGLVHLTRADTVSAFKESLLGRITALANSQRLLSESRGRGADLARLVADELAAFHAPGQERATWSGPAVTLPPTAIQSMVMVLHELAANATKYGALSVDEGRVAIDWSRGEDGALRLRWSESGGPPVAPPSHRGTGTGIIMVSIRSQLGGEVAFTWRPEGLLCELVVPMGR
jgi:two-component sensor histidine kinase